MYLTVPIPLYLEYSERKDSKGFLKRSRTKACLPMGKSGLCVFTPIVLSAKWTPPGWK